MSRGGVGESYVWAKVASPCEPGAVERIPADDWPACERLWRIAAARIRRAGRHGFRPSVQKSNHRNRCLALGSLCPLCRIDLGHGASISQRRGTRHFIGGPELVMPVSLDGRASLERPCRLVLSRALRTSVTPSTSDPPRFPSRRGGFTPGIETVGDTHRTGERPSRFSTRLNSLHSPQHAPGSKLNIAREAEEIQYAPLPFKTTRTVLKMMPMSIERLRFFE